MRWKDLIGQNLNLGTKRCAGSLHLQPWIQFLQFILVFLITPEHGISFVTLHCLCFPTLEALIDSKKGEFGQESEEPYLFKVKLNDEYAR